MAFAFLRRCLILPFLFCLPILAHAVEGWDRVLQTKELRWCADTTGGAPYVFPDEKNPNHIVGFEVELMEAVAKRLDVRPKLVIIQWEELVPALLRGDCDA